MGKYDTTDIIFLLNIKCMEDYAKYSNFINKVIKHELLTEEETTNILFTRRKKADGELGSSTWHKCIGEKYVNFISGKNNGFVDSFGFKKIEEPEGISKITEPFHITYYLWIEEQNLNEIVQYKEIILLMAGYKDADICAQIVGSNGFYFKLSQYLAWTIDKFSLVNTIYYKSEEGIRRLQQANVRQSTAFLPLIFVNQENAHRLRENCIKQLGESVFDEIFKREYTYNDIKEKIEWQELGGIIMQLQYNKKVYKKLELSQLKKVLGQLDVLGLALMAYSMKNYKKDITIAELNSYARIQQQYAGACHQLIENILFHSMARWGLLSVRIHNVDEPESNRYIADYYGNNGIVGDYFEVHICDFSAGKNNQNIAEHFLSQLNDTWQNKFDGMEPENLFKSALGVGDRYIGSWKEYYKEPEYFGKHMGLRIFQGIVKTNKGFFVAESHSDHVNNVGESYCYGISSSEKRYTMPGTTYGILLPLKKSQVQVEKDVTQEYGNWLCINPQRLLEMEACEYTANKTQVVYQSQDNKNHEIRRRIDKLGDFMELEGAGKNIISINSSDFEDNEAELWGKAVLSVQFSLESKPHIVFYDCSEMFILGFKDIMREVFTEAIEGVFWNETFQIALLSKDNEQVVFLPGNVELTNNLNQYFSRMKGLKYDTLYGVDSNEYNVDNVAENFIPFDIMVKKNGETVFENYVKKILMEDIQSEHFGCKISPTHMRLGSTIHVDQFYEAELMFGNIYFISRFAFLILKDIYHSMQEQQNARITLYGYASYSETLLFTLRKAMLALNMDQTLDVDYIILEREEERREMKHEDRIRFRKELNEENDVVDLKNDMAERKFIIIVPINSTMKTHQRLIDLLKEENTKITDENILRNYALILVGPKECDYWQRIDDNKLVCTYHIKPDPKYFVYVQTEYQESLACEMCFPPGILWERPLIEVNAASTIPNQAFGIVVGDKLRTNDLKRLTTLIKNEEKKLQVLRKCLIYGHVTRNDTHFLYYVKTEDLAVEAENLINDSLREWKRNITIESSEYHIIVAPMHYSNCQFVEMVNEQIFSGMAYEIRIDFNKDFRTNAYAKYSNIRQYLRQLAEMGKDITVKFHYVDDNIITGRTFFRAKSLIESMVDYYRETFPHVTTIIFDRVFVMLDRNSIETRMQYLSRVQRVKDVEKYYYCFLHVNISSLRNYGDSCVLCNLQKDAEHLHCSASTGIMADYWEKENKKFQVETIENFVKYKYDNKHLRGYRRLFCTHTLKTALEELGYDNQTEHAGVIILTLLIEDYKYRTMVASQKEAFEYFISYLKVCSRPFLVFHKPIKEAVYDILLIIMEYIIKEESIDAILQSGWNKKHYWKKMKMKWSEFEKEILSGLIMEQRQDLVLLIMKQLTELKSNYIIRIDNMNALFKFMVRFKNVEKSNSDRKLMIWEDFWIRYATHIKKLVGVSSDTSKSMWFDYALLHEKEMNTEKRIKWAEEIEPLFLQIIRLENTTNFYDGIKKIYDKLKGDAKVWKNIEQYISVIYSKRRANLIIKKYLLQWKNSDEYIESEKANEQWEKAVLRYTSDCCAFCPGIVREACRGEQTVNSVWEFANAYLDKHTEQEDEYICNMLQECFQTTTEGYQYMNFRRLMCEMKWGERSDSQEGNGSQYVYTKEGIKQLTCCLVIKKLCEEADYTEEALMKRIDKIAKLAGAILGDCPVQICAEYQDFSEYYKKYINQIVEEKGNELGLAQEHVPTLKMKKHFHTIGGNTGFVVSLDVEIQQLLNLEEVLDRLEKYGYYYEGKEFLWQMGRQSKYPLYLYAKVGDNKSDEIDFLYRVRNLLALSNDIETSLFSAGKQNYLHEVDLANSRLNVLGREKSYSHTKGENRKRNFERLIKGQSPGSHDSLVLLADLNVSGIYRKSLNMEFYQNRESFGGMYLNMEIFNKTINERMHGEYEDGNSVAIIIHNEPLEVYQSDRVIEDGEELIFPKSFEMEILSLLLALILNVKEKGRGIVEDGKIHVYLSQTAEGALRVLNKTNCNETEVQEIKKCLNHEPASEESGITLWSLNACIRRAMVCYIRERLVHTKDQKDMNDVKKRLERLTQEKFEIKLKIEEKAGNSYFSYELPIFRKLYD